jgi:hypothetical protein
MTGSTENPIHRIAPTEPRKPIGADEQFVSGDQTDPQYLPPTPGQTAIQKDHDSLLSQPEQSQLQTIQVPKSGSIQPSSESGQENSIVAKENPPGSNLWLTVDTVPKPFVNKPKKTGPKGNELRF